MVRCDGRSHHSIKLMQQLGMLATPAIFYRDGDGMLRSLIGAPADAELETILGPL